MIGAAAGAAEAAYGAAGAAYGYAMTHPEVIDDVTDFIYGFTPTPPNPSWAGYIGSGISYFLGKTGNNGKK